jgi:LmbE family N-acetylglucosaminyl deacetylase
VTRRLTLTFRDRLIEGTVEARLAVARLIRLHRPPYVFTTKGAGVHPDHRAVTDIVTNGVFYARLPKWNEVGPAANALVRMIAGTMSAGFMFLLPDA